MSSWIRWFRSLQFRWIRFWHYRKGFTKIRYEFAGAAQDNDLRSETLWTKPLGENLYQLENIPVLAEGLNLHDVVKCQEVPNELPVIIEVVRKSGNHTLRVEFREETPAEEAVEVIFELRKRQVFYEKAGIWRYLFNVEPSTDYEAVRDFLKSKEEAGLLWVYE